MKTIITAYSTLLLFLGSCAAVAASAPPLEKALSSRFLEEEEQEEEEQAYYDDDGSQGFGSTIYYGKCFQDGNGNDVVFFMMCPAQSGCQQQCYAGKEYIANLNVFVKNYLQAQLGEYVADDDQQQADEEQQQANDDCQQARQDCADDDNCDEDEDIEECEENVDGGENGDQFKVQKYTECTAFGDYYIGPYCSYYSIYLGLFIDNACTQLMEDDIYSSLYGDDLPFSEASGVSIVYETCASCDGYIEDYQYQGGQKYDVSRCEALFQSKDGSSQLEDGGSNIRIVRAPSGAFLIGLLVVGVIAVSAFAYYIGYCLGPRSMSWIEKKKTLLSFESTDASE